MTKEEFFVTLYEKMPEVYRRLDSNNNYSLKKYVDSMSIGLTQVFDDITNFKKLVNPLECADEYIQVLCDCFYIPFYSDIPIKYYRKLLNDIGNLRLRKGTLNCVHYLCTALTGLDVDVDSDNLSGHILEILLKADSVDKVLDIDVATKTLETFIKDFIPYYIHTVNITSEVTEMTLTNNINSYTLITLEKDITLPTAFSY